MLLKCYYINRATGQNTNRSATGQNILDILYLISNILIFNQLQRHIFDYI